MRQIFWLSIFCVIETIYGLCINIGCTFNGKTYELYSEVQFGCISFQCVNDGIQDFWQFLHIDGSCPQCSVYDDPHFLTFDGHYYDFHRTCNYTISQPVQCCDHFSSNYPPYGIFGDFQICELGAPGSTCLDLTTYKISDDLWIQIKHSDIPSVEINGDPVTASFFPSSYYGCSSFSSVIIFASGNCIYLVGTYYSIHACNGWMVIYTVVENQNEIAGLCGFYSGTTTDEYRLRNCSYLDVDFGYEIPFGEDWKTIDQGEKECRGCSSNFTEVEFCESEGEAYVLCENVINQVFDRCPSGYTENDVIKVIEDCVEDCCSTGFENCEGWANVGLGYLCTLNELAQVTKGKGREKK